MSGEPGRGLWELPLTDEIQKIIDEDQKPLTGTYRKSVESVEVVEVDPGGPPHKVTREAFIGAEPFEIEVTTTTPESSLEMSIEVGYRETLEDPDRLPLPVRIWLLFRSLPAAWRLARKWEIEIQKIEKLLPRRSRWFR